MKIELLEHLRIEKAEMLCHQAVQVVEVLLQCVETEEFLQQLVVVSLLPTIDGRCTGSTTCHSGIEIVYGGVADDGPSTQW